ncbi:MAG: glycoside hydrolase family 31 protein [Acidobacteriaceae bacterium]
MAKVYSLALLLLVPIGSSARAQTATSALPPVRSLSDGFEAAEGGVTLRVTALRDDVLRVRMSRSGATSEDASWAVLPAARKASTPVTSEPRGFHTRSLRVTVGSGLMLTVADLGGNVLQQDAEPIAWHDTSFRLHKTRSSADHFFGLGDKPGPLDRSGQSFVMWNSDNFGWQESSDPIYKSIPFFLNVRSGGRTLGVLFDNTWRTFFDFGRELQDQYSFGAPNGPVDYYLMYGPEPRKVVETYAWLTGPTPLPPLWSLGFQQSRYTYYPQSRVMEIADRLRADHIPTDALYLDIDYQKENRPFTVDTVRFPDFPRLIRELSAKQFHLVTITDLHIAKLPNAGYTPYDSGTAEDRFVKLPDGSVYSGEVWPGASVFPDFTQASTRAWWGGLYKDFVQQGVAGFWNDMNEPAVFGVPTKTMPDAVQHRIDEPGFAARTAGHLEIHNVYGMENSRGTYEGLLKLAPNTRPFVLTRASYAGGQRYAATWTGDNSATWNHLRQTVPQIVNLGLSGFGMTGADVGGFAGSPPADLMTKWMELAAFQPIDRNHSAKGTRDHEPWVDGPEQEAIRRRYVEVRYKLMPYLYSAAEEMSRTGIPIMRPLFLEFPNATTDGHPIDLDAGAEFLFGRDLLVAPNPSPEEVAAYEVQLPPGVWYDFWTGEQFDRRASVAAKDLEQRDAVLARKPLMVTPTLERLPVYVREGAIIPMAPLVQSTEETPSGPLTLQVYAGRDCHGEVYQDDGKSFAYRKGVFLRQSFTCTLNPDSTLTLQISRREGSFRPWWKELRVELFGFHPAHAQARSKTANFKLEQTGAAWIATVGDLGTGQTITFE